MTIYYMQAFLQTYSIFSIQKLWKRSNSKIKISLRSWQLHDLERPDSTSFQELTCYPVLDGLASPTWWTRQLHTTFKGHTLSPGSLRLLLPRSSHSKDLGPGLFISFPSLFLSGFSLLGPGVPYTIQVLKCNNSLGGRKMISILYNLHIRIGSI